ncbi:hypothetical protein A2116_02480 [Candidatus Jorgensenbacteria bacterium GWA1_49_17]|uniref:Uncharacterized protein n=2 Tax=Candidatus Joergenseniibacteriota TaxID=1752739 RepID=A0A1F6BME8_9BACT|nr:MAG: hypothetical protein A2127_01275 [Candidatus Jorgensenbacteria bacterium GWC1_48_12]OGG40930.1 MAG: hypothetical protein A2116_02480 [Candidatus Jorgensenbacteria bacterium GWA1_49_17]
MKKSPRLITHNLRLITTIAIVALLVIGYWSLVIGPARAALEIKVISSPDTTLTTDESIAAYIVRLYWFAVGAAGAVAVAVIVGGAIYYMTSSGSPDKQNEAKSYMTSALWGVTLLLGSYFILNTINPQITSLESLNRAFNLPSCGEVSNGRPGIDCLPAVPKALPVCGEEVATGTPGVNCLPACKASERACVLGEKEGSTLNGEKPCTKCAYSPYIAPEGVGCSAACFFDPDKTGAAAACDFNDPSAVCTAIDKNTNACQVNNPRRPAPCVCENCRIIPDEIPVKTENTCPSSTLGECFLQDSVVEKLEEVFEDNFIRANFAQNKWRITEAFPPVANHASRTHYNGRAFDVAPDPNWTYECKEALEIARKFAQADFYFVLIEGPEGFCSPDIPSEDGPIPGANGVTRDVNNNPFHIHISEG